MQVSPGHRPSVAASPRGRRPQQTSPGSVAVWVRRSQWRLVARVADRRGFRTLDRELPAVRLEVVPRHLDPTVEFVPPPGPYEPLDLVPLPDQFRVVAPQDGLPTSRSSSDTAYTGHGEPAAACSRMCGTRERARRLSATLNRWTRSPRGRRGVATGGPPAGRTGRCTRRGSGTSSGLPPPGRATPGTRAGRASPRRAR